MSVEEIGNKIRPTLKKYKIKKAGIFGSVVRKEATDDSDVDILVELPDQASLFDLAGLKIDLEELLGKKVDVLTYNSLHPLLKEQILAEQVEIL